MTNKICLKSHSYVLSSLASNSFRNIPWKCSPKYRMWDQEQASQFVLIFFLIEGKLLHHVALVSAVPQGKSTIIIHTSPPWKAPSPLPYPAPPGAHRAPGGSLCYGKESACQCRRQGFDPLVQKIS